MPRGNRGNLDPVKTNEEAIKRGSAGGIKSGEAKRKKKIFETAMLLCLKKMKPPEHLKEKMLQDGIPDSAINASVAGAYAMIKKMWQGDTKAYEVGRDTIGEKPVEQTMAIDPPTIIDDV